MCVHHEDAEAGVILYALELDDEEDFDVDESIFYFWYAMSLLSCAM